MRRRALVTGITGQDGSYLAELLLTKGYEVHGLVRRSSSMSRPRIDHLDSAELHLHYGDLTDTQSVRNLVELVRPAEIYNLGAQSHVGVSHQMPDYTMAVDGAGVVRLLEALRAARIEARYYQASTSELFGQGPPSCSEESPFAPRSPYGLAKQVAHEATVEHRERFGQFAVCGMAFNHESPRRGENFVTRKISLGVAAIRLRLRDELALGDLSAIRDWGYAPEYVEAMWRMLQQDAPSDYVLATGRGHSVRDFCREAFTHAGLHWEDHVTHDSRHDRPAEPDQMVGDASKALVGLDWRPATDAAALARLMVDADVDQLSRSGPRPP